MVDPEEMYIISKYIHEHKTKHCKLWSSFRQNALGSINGFIDKGGVTFLLTYLLVLVDDGMRSW